MKRQAKNMPFLSKWFWKDSSNILRHMPTMTIEVGLYCILDADCITVVTLIARIGTEALINSQHPDQKPRPRGLVNLRSVHFVGNDYTNSSRADKFT